MRVAAVAWCVAFSTLISGVVLSAADEPTGATHRTEHYELYCEGELDVVELGRMLESLHAILTRYFGKAPDQTLRIEILADEERFKAALTKARQPYSGGGGVYGPTSKTAFLFVQPSSYYTRQLLLHEATHQFHFLVATGNQMPSAEWYTEGLANYMALHTWDGEHLSVGRIPLISLEDYPAQAIQQLDEAGWDMSAIVAGTKSVTQPAGWMLVHFLINRDYATFRQLASRLDRRDDPGAAFAATFGSMTAELVADFKRWAIERQQPFDDVWIHWLPWGDRLEGYADVMALCVTKQTPRWFEAKTELVAGDLKIGLVFGFQNPHDFWLLEVRNDEKAYLLQREEGRWVRVRTIAAPAKDGGHQFVAEQLGDDSVVLKLNGAEVQRMKAPGRVGLAVDACRARFQVKDVQPAPYATLTELIDAAAAADRPPMPDPNRRDADGRTPLHVAVLEGDVAATERQLAAGANVELTLPSGVTPLMMAAFKGNRPAADLLLKAGADVRRATPLGTTALHYAAARGDLPLVQRFISSGAAIDAKKPGGTTPLILAAQNGHADTIAALVEAGAEVNPLLNDLQITALMLAAQNGHARAVSALLHAGADLQRKDKQGRTALAFARANEQTAVIELLEKALAAAEPQDKRPALRVEAP